MNYLAHAFLSLDDTEIQVGNLMGDFIKGNKFLLYPEKVKQGILLHRKIDHFTDLHPLVHEAICFFKPSFRLSGGIYIDILFDHFLANDTRYFSEDRLQVFTAEVYRNLESNHLFFDEKMKQLFGYMSAYDWLYNYRHQEGLSRSILGMCKRFPILGDGNTALSVIETHYLDLLDIYTAFFPLLKEHVDNSDNVKENSSL